MHALLLSCILAGTPSEVSVPPVPPPPSPGTPSGAPVLPPPEAPKPPTEEVAPKDAPAKKEEPPAEKKDAGSGIVADEREGMGVRLRIKVFGDEKIARPAMDAAFAEIARVEGLLSEQRPSSDISRLNQAAGKDSVAVSAEAIQVLSRGVEVSKLTGGAFAVTWGALFGLWDFRSGADPVVPPMDRIKARLPLVDDNKLILDTTKETAQLVDTGMAVGIGGVGQGYAVHRALTVLRENGVTDALVWVGGDVGTIGKKGERPWMIGIQDPRAAGYFAVMALEDQAVVTSHDYEHFFELEGKRYHHILDPRTGMPARACRSVTVVATDAVTADALSTGIFVLGPTKGLELIEKMPGFEAVIIDADNNLSISSGLKEKLRVVRQPTP